MFIILFLSCLFPFHVQNQRYQIDQNQDKQEKLMQTKNITIHNKNNIKLRSVDHQWNQFKRRSGRSYKNNSEDKKRREVFVKNKKFIEEHNRLADMGLKSYHLKLNFFADLTHQEFLRVYRSHIPDVAKDLNRLLSDRFKIHDQPVSRKLPETVDLRKRGFVTRVKNQEEFDSCASCWAFVAAGALEGHLFLKTGKLVELSSQFFIDCDNRNFGCEGGDTYKAFETVKDFGIYVTEKDYPYRGQKPQKCPFNKTEKIKDTKTKAYIKIPADKEDTMMNVIANKGPVSAIFDALDQEFQFLADKSTDIFSGQNCSKNIKRATHAVLIVGYGTINRTEKYWLVKNSFGKDWGNKGYFKISRNQNMCGIANELTYPIV